MKSARIFVLVPAILIVGFGLCVTPRNWGQVPPGKDAYGPRGAYDKGEKQPSLDMEMDKLVTQEAVAEREVASLMESYAHTEGDTERSQIKSKVAAALEKAFDLQQKRRELELSRVEARVKKIRELMQRRSDARQSIIDKRLDQLLREADGLGWTPPPGVNVQQIQVGKSIYRGTTYGPLPK